MSRFLVCATIIATAFAASCARENADSDATSGPPASETPQAGGVPLGIAWGWISTVTPVERIESVDPARYTLLFQADGQIQARFDCNRGGGSYEIDGNRLSFGPLIATRMACPEDTQDFRFMSNLEQISSYFVRDGELFLEMPFDSGTMRFRRVDE